MGALAALLLLAADVSTNRLLPLDECAQDQSFVHYRDELRQAIASRDAEKMLALVSEGIQTDFGGGQGRKAFASQWELDTPETSKLWSELTKALQLGCALDGEYAAVPRLAGRLPLEMDGFTTVWVVQPNATLHQEMSDDSPVLRKLDWDLLSLAERDGDDDWAAISLGHDRTGYIRRTNIRSAGSYRALFARYQGQWRMTAFVAGD
jgi:hypothetical protein